MIPAATRHPHHGALRLLLASMVAISHLGVGAGGYNIGVMAVMVFYLLAGMVADKLISMPAYASPLIYWFNRVRRIAPLYLFSLAVAAAVWAAGAHSSFLARSPALSDWLANITVIPLAYYMYSGQDAFTLIPPAWSLGVELQFYLLAPFLLPRPKILQAVLWASFALYLCAVSGLVNSDHFGYRLLPGVLFVFLGGAMMHRALKGDTAARRNLLLLWLAIAVLMLWTLAFGRYLPYNYETLLALLAGLPLIYFFSSPLPLVLDRFLGMLSYGVFLLHFPALWIIERAGLELHGGRIPAVLLLSLLLAAIGHIVAERRSTPLFSGLFINKTCRRG